MFNKVFALSANKSFWICCLIFGFFLAGYAFFMTSGVAKSEYQDICASNYGGSSSYFECMDFLNKQGAYFFKVKVIALTMVVLGLALMVISKIRDQKN